jgi:hypothetical protein
MFRIYCLATLAVIGPEPSINELLNTERDIPNEFYSGNALDIGSILDIR